MQKNIHQLDFSKKIQLSMIEAKDIFSIDQSIKLPKFSSDENNEHIDPDYIFNPEITKSICYALAKNKTLYLHGLHGSGKSTHIEQVAAKLNWPCLRINLDSQITRMDLIGKDVICLENNQQIMKFEYGLLPTALKQPLILILDEYDAARPELQFILHRLLESTKSFPLIETNETIAPHLYFRLFATANSAGTGDETGLYHGTHLLNQGHMDRWNMIVKMPKISLEYEQSILEKKLPEFTKSKKKLQILKQMLQFTHLTREAFENQHLTLFLSLRTLLNWGENYLFLQNIQTSLEQTIWSRFSNDDQEILKEFFQRCFGKNWSNDK